MSHETKRKTVLIIDDDDDLCFAMRRVLEAHGYDVCWAADGDEGIQMVRSQPPDIIILDFMMPEKSGFSVCHDISRDPDLPNPPIMALTAFGQNIGELHGLGDADVSGLIQEYLEKPVEPNVLLARMKNILYPEKQTEYSP